MLLKMMLKTNRQKKGFTQEQVAKKLYLSTQAVSKWETGQSVPSIDNLLLLSDLYDLSLDELVQGSPFFKKPHIVGKKYTPWKGCFFLIIWLFICLIFTGFGYQPIWLFGLLYLLGIFIILPVMAEDYWVIDLKSIVVKRYSTRNLIKLLQIVMNRPQTNEIFYTTISKVEILYINRQRLSPFDFNCDNFYLLLSYNNKKVKLDLNVPTKFFLPQFIDFLSRKQISVIDNDQIIKHLIADDSLYDLKNKIH